VRSPRALSISCGWISVTTGQGLGERTFLGWTVEVVAHPLKKMCYRLLGDDWEKIYRVARVPGSTRRQMTERTFPVMDRIAR
jgi:hypothetical protein